MGGYGSGQYYRHNGKTATIDMLSININNWRKKGKWKYINTNWIWSRNGKQAAGINFKIIVEQNEIILSWSRNGKNETQTIMIYAKPQPYGKCRYYFVCGKCHTLRSKLYSTPYFYCRDCCNLTYQSCKESHQYASVGRTLGMTKEGFERYMKEDRENELYMRSDLKTRRRLDKKQAKRDAKFPDIRSYFR